MATSECLSEALLLDLSEGRLPAAALEAASTHLEGCASCQGRLEAFDGRTLTVARALRATAPDQESTESLAGDRRISAHAPVSGRIEPEVRALLQRRLQVLSLASVFGAGALLAMRFSRTADAVTAVAAQQVGVWLLVLCTAGALASSVYLWRHREAPLGRLRVIELSLLAAVCAFAVHYRIAVLAAIPDLTFASAAHRELFVEQATLVANLGWYLLIVGYGLFVPNTGRRCLVVVAAMSAVALGSLLAVGTTSEPVRRQLPVLASNTLMGLGLTGAMAVFGSFRISTLQREVVVARRLGQYRLLRKLGSGGMGEVYLAEHALLKRPCAVKMIRTERASDPRLLQRFEREVQATARLSHRNIVEVYDYGRTGDGTFYYVMEYLPGPNLAVLVRRNGPLPAGRAVHLLRQLCGALREAHAAGLVHRDLKPGNVIVGQEGGQFDVVKLLDFGLVRSPGLESAEGGDLTQEGILVGTPDYMAPEQALGLSVDARTDLYSLGALAYFLLTGRPPFTGLSTLDTLHAHARLPAPPLASQASGVPADLIEIVMRCLAKAPAERFPDASSLEVALAACACTSDWTNAEAGVWWRGQVEAPAAIATEPTA